jgi:hypothetical protein
MGAVALHGVGDVAPLTITGLAEAGQHVVVKLDTWEAHGPIAMIPIRGMGHRIDLGGRLNGNLKIRRSSFF